MKPFTAFALSALLSPVTAQPMLEKRDGSTLTVTDVVVVTVDVTLTGNPPTASPVANNKHANHLAYHAQSQAEAQAQSTLSTSPPPVPQAPAQDAPAPVEQKEAVAPPASPSSAAAAAPSSGSSPEQIQAAEDAKQEAINQQQTDENNPHHAQMNELQNGGGSSNTPAPAPQAPTSAAPQAPAQSPAASSSSSGSGGGSCGSVGGSCSGDVTIYNDQGLGACGWANDTNSEDFFALAAPMFGDYTNDGPGGHKNAYCGRMASIQVNGQSYTGMLTDRCGGCVGQSIDLSQHLFSQLYPNEPPGNGRYHNVPWEFTSGPIYSGA